MLSSVRSFSVLEGRFSSCLAKLPDSRESVKKVTLRTSWKLGNPFGYNDTSVDVVMIDCSLQRTYKRGLQTCR